MGKDNKNKILDEDFWVKLSGFEKILGPIADAITFIEADIPRISCVLGIFKSLKEQFDGFVRELDVDDDVQNTIFKCLANRKSFCIADIHYAATLLDPSKRSDLTPAEVLDGIETIYTLANTAIDLDVDVIMGEVAEYNSKEGFFSKQFLWSCADSTPPLTWWKGLCSTQQLSKVAMKVIGAPATSAAVERSFSKHLFVQSKTKNRLTNARAEKLVFISSNLKLLSNKKEEKNKKKPQML